MANPRRRVKVSFYFDTTVSNMEEFRFGSTTYKESVENYIRYLIGRNDTRDTDFDFPSRIKSLVARVSKPHKF